MFPIIRKMRHSDIGPLTGLRQVTFFEDGKISREADAAGLANLIDGDGYDAGFVAIVEKHARSVGCDELYLYTDAAEALYAKLGWVVAERMVIDGEPLMLMKRTF